MLQPLTDLENYFVRGKSHINKKIRLECDLYFFSRGKMKFGYIIKNLTILWGQVPHVVGSPTSTTGYRHHDIRIELHSIIYLYITCAFIYRGFGWEL